MACHLMQNCLFANINSFGAFIQMSFESHVTYLKNNMKNKKLLLHICMKNTFSTEIKVKANNVAH